MAFGDLTQFDYFYNALAQRYPGIKKADAKTTTFQFMDTPMAASWDHMPADGYNLANATSQGLDGFFVPGNNFAGAYQSMVTSIEPTRGKDNSNYQDCVIQLAALDTKKQSLVKQEQAEFKLYLADNPGTQVTISQWLADPDGGQSFADERAEIDVQRVDFLTTQKNILAALDGPLSRAQGAVNPWADTMNITQGQQVQKGVPLVTLSGDLASDVAKWTARPAGQYDFDVTIKASDTITSPWKTTYTTEVHSDCWGTSVSVRTNTKRIISDNQYKLQIAAVGMNSYKINRGRWFDESLVSPSVNLVEGSAWTPDMFFGLNGSLHLIPDEVFVMFRPMIKLTTSTQVFKQEIEANSDAQVKYLDLMGFRFNIDGMASLQPVGDEKTTTVTFNAPANQPAQIVGVVSKVAWNGNKGSTE